MARVHGLPGIYPSAEAAHRFDRVLAITIGTIMAAGFGSGFVWSAFGHWWGLIAAWTAVAAFAGSLRLLRPRLDAYERERRAYLRGAEGERLVAWILDQLPEDWHIFHGIVLNAGKDLDHVAVGPGGVFYIATKNYRGLFSRSTTGDLLYNNKPTSLAQQVLRDTMAFRDRLCAVIGRDVYVQAILTAPFAYVDLPGAYRNVWILHRENLLRVMEAAPKRFGTAEIDACVKALELLAESGLDVRLAAAKAKLGEPSPRGDRPWRRDGTGADEQVPS